jgi:hypothetical protein
MFFGSGVEDVSEKHPKDVRVEVESPLPFQGNV